MTYTLKFVFRFGLWELRIDKFRIRFYATRYGAEKLIARYRRALQSQYDRDWNSLTPTQKIAEFDHYNQ